jgi:uncharacterized protein (TIGR00290 family)
MRTVPTPTLVCLVPVRNGAEDLPGYLTGVGRFAEAVVALDDGSTDATRAILEASPLVRVLLTNPPRSDYAGWDDAANRQRLLEAAAALGPGWVLFLDADERIPADDGAALRAFVQTEALPGCAYGFKVYRMRGDLAHYDRAGLWVYRLFAWEPGQQLPARRRHFVPVPTAIPRQRWLRTTLRIQHLAGLTPQRRQARVAKYAQADPDHAFQHSYRDLLEAPQTIRPWVPRPAHLPVLDIGAVGADADARGDNRHRRRRETKNDPVAAEVMRQERPSDAFGGDRSDRDAPTAKIPALQLWSGGKDSAFALWVTRLRGELDVQALATIIVDGPDRSNWHGVRTELMHRQSAAIGLPLHEIRVPSPDVETKLEAIQAFLRSPTAAAHTAIVWGDIHDDGARGAHARVTREAGKSVTFPLWRVETSALAQAVIEAGFETVVTAIASWGKGLHEGLAGREFDDAFLADLPGWVDPCGEGGEFHTFVYDGPIFSRRVAFQRKGIVRNEPYIVCDLVPADD